jgi:hypothetical protein
MKMPYPKIVCIVSVLMLVLAPVSAGLAAQGYWGKNTPDRDLENKRKFIQKRLTATQTETRRSARNQDKQTLRENQLLQRENGAHLSRGEKQLLNRDKGLGGTASEMSNDADAGMENGGDE